METFGDLHIVVDNAAVSRPRALVNMTEEEFDDVVVVKLKGTYAVSRWAARYWRQRYEARVPDCPLTGQVLSVRGSTVTLNHNWSLGERVGKENAGWTVTELARALDELPFDDHFDKLAYVRRAYDATSREQLEQLLATILDNDDPVRT